MMTTGTLLDEIAVTGVDEFWVRKGVRRDCGEARITYDGYDTELVVRRFYFYGHFTIEARITDKRTGETHTGSVQPYNQRIDQVAATRRAVAEAANAWADAA